MSWGHFTTRIVLVGSKHEFNIGLVSRIMSNFDLEQLILVAPQCSITVEAFHGAAGGNGPLKNLLQVSDWTQFGTILPPGVRVGFTPKSGTTAGRNDFTPFLHTYSNRISEAAADSRFQNLYLVFGAEDNGLSSQDLSQMDVLCQVPTRGDFRSLSLSHAVTVALTLLNCHFEGPEVATPVADAEVSIVNWEPWLDQWLSALGLDLSRPTNAAEGLKRLIRRGLPSQNELQIFQKLLAQTVRKLSNK